MASKINPLVQLCASLLLVFLCGCSKDNDTPSQFDNQIVLLENNGNPWVLTNGTVIKDGFDVSSQFEGFQLSISGNNYSTANSLKDVWEAQGSWSFHENNVNVLERNDGVLLTIILSDNELTVSFTDPKGSNGGSLEGISGDYTFNLLSE